MGVKKRKRKLKICKSFKDLFLVALRISFSLLFLRRALLPRAGKAISLSLQFIVVLFSTGFIFRFILCQQIYFTSYYFVKKTLSVSLSILEASSLLSYKNKNKKRYPNPSRIFHSSSPPPPSSSSFYIL